MAGFLKELRRFVLDEAASTRQRIYQIWSKPLPARVAEGQAIEGIRVETIRPDGVLVLTCTRNSSRFREGDMLCLTRGDPLAQPQAMVTLEEDDETRLLVSCADPALNWLDLQREQGGWALDLGYLDLSHWILDALDEAGDTLAGRTRILPLIMGYAHPQVDAIRYTRGLEMGEAFGLNWSQSEALAQAYATDLTYLVQGPPGTGKTRVLAHLAQALVSDGERVFVTAFTHRAINNALNKLADVDPTVPAAKIGRVTRADDLYIDNHEYFSSSPLSARHDGYVVGATPFATRNNRLAGVEFDTVIFDEASQITLPLAIMGMLPARKYIFIGDQHQLPPVLNTRDSDSAFRDSVFGLLADRGFDTMLTQTYRLNTELTTWPSKHFYDNSLIPAPSIAGRRLAYARPPARLADILDPDEPKTFWDLKLRNTTIRSHREAGAVVDLIHVLLQCGVPPQEIGVVVPYRAQAREIRNRLRSFIPAPQQRRQLVIDTVERMQGQERDVIILSLTTASPGFAALIADFLFQPQRLNVAVTRPRSKLIIVGSSHVLNARPEDPDLVEAVLLMQDLLASCAYYTFAP